MEDPQCQGRDSRATGSGDWHTSHELLRPTKSTAYTETANFPRHWHDSLELKGLS